MFVSTWYHKNHLVDLCQAHVDDFRWAGSDEFKANVLDCLWKKYQVGKVFLKTFAYTGINISQDSDKITLNQIDYINSIKPIPISPERQLQCNKKWSDCESTSYCHLVGQLNWVANQSRPDICLDVCQPSSTMKALVIADLFNKSK